MFESLKNALGGIAPSLISSLVPGGPLVHAGISAALNAFGISEGDQPEDKQEAAQMLIEKVQSATPEQILALKKADHEMEQFMAEIGYKETALFVDDTKDARRANSDNNKVFWLGVVVLLTFATVMGFAMWGSYEMLSNGMGKDLDTGVVAAVFGFLGTAVGYVAANAQQVIAFFFGSSKGSKEKTDAMASAFREFGVKNER